MFMYVGTYSTRGSKGVYVYRFNATTGAITPVGSAGGVENPSFLAVHPNRRYVYAASEVYSVDGQPDGRVAAFAIDPSGSGRLTLLNHQSSRGSGPCFVTVDKGGKNVLAATYGGGTVSVLPVGPDGSLRPATTRVQHTGPSKADPKRQDAPHAHSVHVDASDRFAVAADLGLDKLLIYRYDAAKGTITPNRPAFAASKPGAGPRQFAFQPGGRFAYAINELDVTVTAYSWDGATGTLTPIQTISSLPTGYDVGSGDSGAEIQVHPNGRWVYSSNRGHDSIAAFAVDKASGRLRAISHTPSGGKSPRHFGIDPAGRFLVAAHQNSDSLVVHKIDGRSGRLTPTGTKIEVPAPVCVVFVP
jgi:6-phosphogluconolactonase